MKLIGNTIVCLFFCFALLSCNERQVEYLADEIYDLQEEISDLEEKVSDLEQELDDCEWKLNDCE